MGVAFYKAAEIRLHFRCAEIMELIPSSRDQATVRWTVALCFSNPAFHENKNPPVRVDFYFVISVHFRYRFNSLHRK